MQLNQYHVPESRLYPQCIQDIKTIYEAAGSEATSSLDVAKMLGYKSNTTGAYYRRLEALAAYGLVERHGKIRVTDLGKRITYPESQQAREDALREAILHVPLWAELYKKVAKNPSTENFWVQIRNITGVEAPLAQKVETTIRNWYLEDVAHITEHFSVSVNENVSVSDSMSIDIDSKKISLPSFGVLTANGIGRIDITDVDTLGLARSALEIIAKKITADDAAKRYEKANALLNGAPTE